MKKTKCKLRVLSSCFSHFQSVNAKVFDYVKWLRTTVTCIPRSLASHETIDCSAVDRAATDWISPAKMLWKSAEFSQVRLIRCSVLVYAKLAQILQITYHTNLNTFANTAFKKIPISSLEIEINMQMKRVLCNWIKVCALNSLGLQGRI